MGGTLKHSDGLQPCRAQSVIRGASNRRPPILPPLYVVLLLLRRHLPDTTWPQVTLGRTRYALVPQASVIDPHSMAMPRQMCVLDIRYQLSQGNQVISHLHGRAATTHLPAPALPRVDRIEAGEGLLRRSLEPVGHTIGVQQVHMQVLLTLQGGLWRMHCVLVWAPNYQLVDEVRYQRS